MKIDRVSLCRMGLAVAGLCFLPVAGEAQTYFYQQLAFFGTPGGLGKNPGPSLTLGTNGTLYGTTTGGGRRGVGTIFSVATSAVSSSVLNNLTAISPSGLTLGPDGALYGTTENGGSFGNGSVYKLVPSSGSFQTLHNFGSVTNDGGNVGAGLTLGSDGTLYGATFSGGQYSSGVVYKINPDGTGYTILHQFADYPTDGRAPAGRLSIGQDGLLYGVTAGGGTFNEFAGSIFKLGTAGDNYTLLHSISFSEGYSLGSGLIQGVDGLLYGATAYGGTYDGGVIYQISTNGTGYTMIYSFPRTDNGALGSVVSPSALTQGSDGYLYGTTYYGGDTNVTTNGFGTVFKVNTNGSNYTVLYTFHDEDGQNPQSGVVMGSDGSLYGTTVNGGYAQQGVVFKLSTNLPPVAVVALNPQFTPTNTVLTYTGPAQLNCRIEASTNLADPNAWQFVGTNSTDAYGLFQIQTTGTTNAPSRFYRVTQPIN